MKRLLNAPLTALALVFAVVGGAQAGPSPALLSWSYNWEPGAPSVTADGNPAAGVTFTDQPVKTAVGPSDIVATNLRVFSAAAASSPDVLSANGAYTLTLQLSIVDNGNPFSATLHFSGKLSGTLSAQSANVTNLFGPNTLQTVQLGSYNFTVQLGSYTPPGPPDQTNAGSIAAHVSITKITPTQDSPEPSTLVLSGFGLTFLGGAVWRRKRRQQQQQRPETEA
jgi:hypothetical protein